MCNGHRLRVTGTLPSYVKVGSRLAFFNVLNGATDGACVRKLAPPLPRPLLPSDFGLRTESACPAMAEWYARTPLAAARWETKPELRALLGPLLSCLRQVALKAVLRYSAHACAATAILWPIWTRIRRDEVA